MEFECDHFIVQRTFLRRPIPRNERVAGGSGRRFENQTWRLRIDTCIGPWIVARTTYRS
jgi:hypothetical protein